MGGRSGRLEGEVGSGQWGKCNTRTRKEKGFQYLTLPCGVAIAGHGGECCSVGIVA